MLILLKNTPPCQYSRSIIRFFSETSVNFSGSEPSPERATFSRHRMHPGGGGQTRGSALDGFNPEETRDPTAS
jgi:hypothetical protein